MIPMEDQRGALFAEMVKVEILTGDPCGGDKLGHYGLEKHFVGHPSAAEKFAHLRLAAGRKNFLQRRPAESPPLRSEVGLETPRLADFESESALQVPALVEEFGVGAPTDVVAVLPALVVEAVGDPPFLLVVDAFDVLKARVGLQKVLQLTQRPQRVVVAAEQGHIINGLPGRLDGLQAVQRCLHHAPEPPVNFNAFGGENAGGLTGGELLLELRDKIHWMPLVPVERDKASLRSQADD